MRRNVSVVCLLLLATVAVVCAARPNAMDGFPASRRALFQEEPTEEDAEETPLTPEERAAAREAEREAAALAAHEERQARKANESARVIERASLTAQETVQVYLNSSRAERIETLAELLRNADGVAFKFVLNTLMSQGGSLETFARRFAHKAIGKALREGFATNVAQAIAVAFTIRQNNDDHVYLLDVISFRKEKLDSFEEDAGCTFVKNLFTDADLLAHERGDSHAFLTAFDSEEYLPLMECFLDPCTGQAGECCASESATSRGLCGCPRNRPNRCDFNIFSYRPRTIWVCSRADCAPTQKCLCPAMA